MRRIRTTGSLLALAACAALTATGCSSHGGAKAASNAANGISAGSANTAHMTFAMVTHAAPGDTFWDIVRKGAETAAAKDNVTLKYYADQDATKQAQLVTNAIDSKVD